MEQENEKFNAVIDGVDDIDPKKHKKKKKPEKTGLKYELLDLLKTFIICFVCVFVITTFLAKPVRVDGRSMYPTLEDGEIGIMNVFSAKFQDIDRFDVVVVYNEEKKENWVKRVIGLPGDTIYAKNDVVYVNGMAIDEPYLNSTYVKQIQNRGDMFTGDFDKVTLGDDEYFLMGDNRIVSHDSRKVGPFKREDIKGKGVMVIFPFTKIKLVG